MSQSLVQKTRDFGKRQASRRAQEKNARVSTAIRHPTWRHSDHGVNSSDNRRERHSCLYWNNFIGDRRSFREYDFKMETWHVIKHYISTSRTPRVLDAFIDTHKPNPDYDNDQWRRIGGVVFRILIPKDTPIIYIGGEEKEVLFPPGKLFLYRHIPYQQRRYAQTGDVTVLDAIYNRIS